MAAKAGAPVGERGQRRVLGSPDRVEAAADQHFDVRIGFRDGAENLPPAPGDEQPDADGGVARRHGRNRGGGKGCGYAASLGQRKRVAHIPTAEAARCGLIF